MKFGMNPAPYYRGKRSTTQIMLELLIGLGVIWIAAIIYYFFVGIDNSLGISNGIRAVVNPIITSLACIVTEVLFLLPKHIKNKDSFKTLLTKVLNSYGYITGFILALLLPVATSYYALIISSIFATAVGKMVFGGFGYNIFNPAIIGRIFAQMVFNNQMQYDTTISTGATITTELSNYGWSLDIISQGEISLVDLLIGNYRGAMGETFTILILIVGIILMIRRVIDWRISLSYIATVLVSSFFMGLVGGYGIDSFEFALVQMSVGSVLFGAIFCITDPVTSPTSQTGKIFFAVGAGLFTVIIRFLGASPEGVGYSILIMNMLTPLIDSSIKGLTNQNIAKKSISITIMASLAITAGIVSSAQIDKTQFVNFLNNGQNDSKALSCNVKYVDKTESGTEIYNAIVEGNLKTNYSQNYGKVTKVFKNQLLDFASYFTNPSYSNVYYEGDESTLYIKYTEDGVKKEETIFKLQTAKAKDENADGSKNWEFRTNKNADERFQTGFTDEDYKSIYSIEINEDLEIVITYPSDHTAKDETSVSYSSVNFNVEIDYEKRLIVSTDLISTGAGGGVGEIMLGGVKDENGNYAFNIGQYTITEENAQKAAKFYEDYIEIKTPVSFDEYLGKSNGSIDISGADTSLKVGATYSANGYMFALESVIEYAEAFHKSKDIGKIGKVGA